MGLQVALERCHDFWGMIQSCRDSFQTNENLPWLHSLSFTTVYKQAACCARATKYPSFGMVWGLLKIHETVAE